MGGLRPKIQHRSIATFMSALAASMLVSCSSEARSDSPRAPGTPEVPSSPGADRAVALDVCTRFTEAALGSDAEVDRGPADARQRAAQLFGTPDLAARLTGEGRDQEWPLIAQHGAQVIVDTEPINDDPAVPADDQAGVGVVARRVAVGASGWRRDLASIAVYCSLARTRAGVWLVSDVTFADSTPAGVPR